MRICLNNKTNSKINRHSRLDRQVQIMQGLVYGACFIMLFSVRDGTMDSMHAKQSSITKLHCQFSRGFTLERVSSTREMAREHG